MYFPAFFKAKYIPLSVIDGAWIKKSVMPIKGCCGGSIPIYVLRICCGSHFFQNIKLENRKDADQALALLKEYRPGLCDSPVVAEEKAYSNRSIMGIYSESEGPYRKRFEVSNSIVVTPTIGILLPCKGKEIFQLLAVFLHSPLFHSYSHPYITYAQKDFM